MALTLQFDHQDQILLLLGPQVQDGKRGLFGWIIDDATSEGPRRWRLRFRFLVDGRTFDALLEPAEEGRKGFLNTRWFRLSSPNDIEMGPHEQQLLQNLGRLIAQQERMVSELAFGADAPSQNRPAPPSTPAGDTLPVRLKTAPLARLVGESAPPPARLAEWPSLAEGWEYRSNRIEGPQRVVLALIHAASGTEMELLFSPRDEERRCLVRNEFANVEYRTLRSELPSARQREAALELVANLADRFPEFYRLFPHLLFNAQRLPASDEERQRQRGENLPALAHEMTFSAQGIAEFLSPEIVPGRPFLGDWELTDITFGNTARSGEAVETYHLIFRSKALDEHLAVILFRDDETRSAYSRTEHFGVNILHNYRMGSRELSPHGLAVLSYLLSVLAIKDLPSLVVREAEEESLRVSVAENAEHAGSMYNLALNPNCGQQCVFCSILDVIPPEDHGKRTLFEAKAGLIEARANGATGVRINGIDPLSFSKLWETLEAIKALEFAPVEVYAPGVQFADEAFARRYLTHMPEEFTINLPLYGLEARYHDAVTGKPGSFEQVWAGLGNLLELCGPQRLHVLSVPVRQNVEGFAALAQWCEEQGIRFSGHQPYPNTGGHDDPYLESVLPMREVASIVGRDRPFDSVSDIPPCVPFWLNAETNRPVFAYWGYGPETTLAGSSYTEASEKIYHAPENPDIFTVATVPCPHQDACIFARFCPRRVYRLYAERFGLEELRPVHLIDLMQANVPRRRSDSFEWNPEGSSSASVPKPSS